MFVELKLKYYVLAIAIILIDQLSKVFLINKSFTIIPNVLDITYTENYGAAFGIGTKYIIMLFSVIIIVGILTYIIHEKNKITSFSPYILILAGSIGNLIDRLFRGYVIDFIDLDFMNFPIFNIADICITLGVCILLVNFLKNKIKQIRG